MTFCSIGVLHFETGPTANIKGADDAFWWAITTMTTVGYGDRFPVTAEGRLIAIVLMSAGVGLFGVFSGFLASWFVGDRGGLAEGESEIAGLRREIAALRSVVEDR